MRLRRTETAEEKQDRLYFRQASGAAAMEEYRADQQSLRELTARLRADRLGREASTPSRSVEENRPGQSEPEER
jgi:hypothetical protein